MTNRYPKNLDATRPDGTSLDATKAIVHTRWYFLGTPIFSNYRLGHITPLMKTVIISHTTKQSFQPPFSDFSVMDLIEPAGGHRRNLGRRSAGDPRLTLR